MEPVAHQGGKGKAEIAAREIVHPAIAFRLADHRNDIGRLDATRIEQRRQAAEIAGMLHRQAMDDGLHGVLPPPTGASGSPYLLSKLGGTSLPLLAGRRSVGLLCGKSRQVANKVS